MNCQGCRSFRFNVATEELRSGQQRKRIQSQKTEQGFQPEIIFCVLQLFWWIKQVDNGRV